MTILIALQVDFAWINFAYDLSIQFLLKLIHWFAESDTLFFSEIPMNLAEVLFLCLIVYLLRPLLLKIDFKNSMRLIIAVLVFLVMRTGFGIFENQKEEILLHDFNKTKVLSVKKGNRACFWIAENADKQKIITFITSPYCASRRIRNMEIKTFPHTVQKVVYKGKMYDLK